MAFLSAFQKIDITKVSSNPADGRGQAAIRIGDNSPDHCNEIILTLAEAWKLAEALIAECEKVELAHRRAARPVIQPATLTIVE